MLKLSLGAGMLRKDTEGWVYNDVLDLEGIDVVHNLNEHPWPFVLSAYDIIEALDLLEHIDDPIAFVNACGDFLRPGGKLLIRTPRYDADFLWIDPSHKRGFHEQSMDFWDPDTNLGKATGFYATTKFKVHVDILPNKNLVFSMVKR